MICDECGKNPAVFSVTITSGGETSNRHLCNECMKKMESGFTQGNIPSFLSSILGMLGAAHKQEEQTVCSHCGLSYSEFERTGRLGCAMCYQDFQKELKPMLQRIHGSSQHVGRFPTGYTPASEESIPAGMDAAPAEPKEPTALELRQKQIEELRQKMDEAVAVENFEAAAHYRDEIRALSEEAGEPT
ncbi:MAG: hypothetical protein E7320_01025 [Clostridiales bacterium]|nr:hypothetical protein [Clostridiales bacterium]